jgi:hypothetical protein
MLPTSAKNIGTLCLLNIKMPQLIGAAQSFARVLRRAGQKNAAGIRAQSGFERSAESCPHSAEDEGGGFIS